MGDNMDEWVVERRARRTKAVRVDGEERMMTKSARQRLRKKRLAQQQVHEDASSSEDDVPLSAVKSVQPKVVSSASASKAKVVPAARKGAPASAPKAKPVPAAGQGAAANRAPAKAVSSKQASSAMSLLHDLWEWLLSVWRMLFPLAIAKPPLNKSIAQSSGAARATASASSQPSRTKEGDDASKIKSAPSTVQPTAAPSPPATKSAPSIPAAATASASIPTKPPDVRAVLEDVMAAARETKPAPIPEEAAQASGPKRPSERACGGQFWQRGRFLSTEVEEEAHSGLVRCVALGEEVALSGGWDNCIKVWDWKDSLAYARTLTGHTDRVEGVALDAAGGRAVTASRDCSVRVWDVLKGRQLSSIYTYDSLSCMAGAWATGCAVVGARSGAVNFWSLDTGKKAHSLKGHVEEVTCLCLMAGAGSGEAVWVSGGADANVRVWDVRAGRTVSLMSGCERKVLALAAVDYTLWAGDFSGSVKVFDIRNPTCGDAVVAEQPNAPLDGGVGSAPIAGVCVSDDGCRIYSSAAAYWDEEDDDNDGPDGCIQVHARNGFDGEYMYTLCTTGGLISSISTRGDRLLAGHVGGGLFACELSTAKKSNAAVWEADHIGCEPL